MPFPSLLLGLRYEDFSRKNSLHFGFFLSESWGRGGLLEAGTSQRAKKERPFNGETKNAGVYANIECMVSEGSVESVERMQNSGNGDGSGPIADLYIDESLGGCWTRWA